jgi:F-type H+-transporting ATPase subunit a
VSHFSWFQLVPGLNQLPDHTVVAALVPDAGLTARNALETFVENFAQTVEGVLGHGGRRYVHVYGTFFLFILAANLTGLLPGISPPTGNFNVTLALGLLSFVLFIAYGIRANGLGNFLKHMLGPIWWIGFLMFPLEAIDMMVRPFSLALRLFGNMTGDHLVLGIFTDLTKLFVPVVFYFLGWFVSIVQAFVFTLLSLVYVALAVGGHEEHH